MPLLSKAQSYNICETLRHLKARKNADKDLKLTMHDKLQPACSGSLTVKISLTTTTRC